MYIVWSSENDLASAIKFVSRRWSGPSNIEWDIEIYRPVRFSWAPSSQYCQQRFWLNLGSEKKRELERKGAQRKKESYFRWSIRSIFDNLRDPAPFNVFFHLVRYESIYDQTIHRNIPRFVDGRLSVILNKESLLHRERNKIFGHRNNRKKILVTSPDAARNQNEKSSGIQTFLADQRRQSAFLISCRSIYLSLRTNTSYRHSEIFDFVIWLHLFLSNIAFFVNENLETFT